MFPKNEFECIILAAGEGLRYGSKKQFEFLENKEVWKHVKDTADKVAKQVIVVGVDVPGGTTRQESVKIGLQHINTKRVVILDAVRPLVTVEQILEIANHHSSSVSYGLPSTDTVINGKMFLPRENLICLQVPQAFDTELLKIAHSKTESNSSTDDCRLMQEVHQIDPTILQGGKNLHKLTHSEDLAILEAILCKLL